MKDEDKQSKLKIISDYTPDVTTDQFSSTENALKQLGLYPCDRKTMFGKAGSHAYYRSKKFDINKRPKTMGGTPQASRLVVT